MPSTKRKARFDQSIKAPVTTKPKGRLDSRVVDAKAAVLASAAQQIGDDAIEITSSSENEEDEYSDDGADEYVDADTDKVSLDLVDRKATPDGTHAQDSKAERGSKKGEGRRGGEDEDMGDDAEEASDNEPAFGDLVRGQETVDVSTVMGLLRQTPADGASTAVTATATTTVSAPTDAAVMAAQPSLSSLGHLLNAALRSSDEANLEVCFNTTTDATWIRNTIQRLDPDLAGPLLQKLAARMHRRPGRAHTLIGWVQWTLISHGGALATQPGVTRALQDLHQVLEERARGLNSLLLLKGKLDMLEAQMQLRRNNRAAAATGSRSIQASEELASATDKSTAASKATATTALASASLRENSRRRLGRGRNGNVNDDEDDEEDAFDGVTTYIEADEDESGQIPVNGRVNGADNENTAAADMDILAGPYSSDDDDNDEVGDDDDDSDNAAAGEEGGEVSEDEVDFDDIDDDEDDDDDEPDVVPPPAKLVKKSAKAFSKRR